MINRALKSQERWSNCLAKALQYITKHTAMRSIISNKAPWNPYLLCSTRANSSFLLKLRSDYNHHPQTDSFWYISGWEHTENAKVDFCAVSGIFSILVLNKTTTNLRKPLIPLFLMKEQVLPLLTPERLHICKQLFLNQYCH